MEHGNWHEAMYARMEAEWDYFDARDHFYDARQELRESRASDWPRKHLAPLDREVAIWGHICRKRRANVRALLALETARRAEFAADFALDSLVESFYPSDQYARLQAEYRHYQIAAEEMDIALPVLRRIGQLVKDLGGFEDRTPVETALLDAWLPWQRWDEHSREGFIGPGGYYRAAGKNKAGIPWIEIPGPDGLTQEERAQAIEDARAKKEGRKRKKVETAPRPH